MKGILKTPDAYSTRTSTPNNKKAHAGRLWFSPVADAFHYNNEDGTSYYDSVRINESQSGKRKRRQNMVAEKGVLTKIEETVDGLSEFQKASVGMVMCLFILLMYYLENY